MTNIEQKALALAREVSPDDKNRVCKEPTVYFALWEALCRAIEQHEAFRQEVSDALEKRGFYIDDRDLGRFIITKPDPLVEIIKRNYAGSVSPSQLAYAVRKELDERGLEIREKE